jgi:hypothetical protein
MGFFLFVCPGVAALVEQGVKIFHSDGVGCAQGYFAAFVVTGFVDVALCRRLQSYPGRVVCLLDVLLCS